MIETILEEVFQEKVLESEAPVLVEFYAGWSGPGKLMHKYLLDLTGKYKDNLKVYSIPVEENSSIIKEYNIKAYPTLLFFNKGRIMEKIIGVPSIEETEKIINRLIS